jgi:hypothetical protein
MNDRASAQDSVMTLHSANMESMNAVNDDLENFKILEGHKAEVRMMLKRFGLSEDRIYGDLITAATMFNASLRSRNEFDELLNIDRSASPG